MLLTVRGLARRPWFEARSLQIAAGEIVVLRGPSGSGKTLFLRAIADLDPTDEGEVFLRGEARSSMEAPRWRSRVRYVHQGAVRLSGSVGDHVGRLLELKACKGGPGAHGLREEAEMDRLSGGEAQALALACAFMGEPEVLLLDEATGAMDAERAATWEARVRDWVSGGRAVLWVAHEAGLAARLGAREERF